MERSRSPGRVGSLWPLMLLCLLPGGQPNQQAVLTGPISTFSIVAHDPQTGDLGVAVASRFFGVGAVVPYAAAGVGALATQARANPTYGPKGLALLREGVAAVDVLERLVTADKGREERQLGLVDAHGQAVTHTGARCLAWAGGRSGDGYAVQGNILAGRRVVDSMATAYEAAGGELAVRLLAALKAGQAAGGDARGRQSAALLVVREGAGYGGTDRYVDIRVDDNAAPIQELSRILDVRRSMDSAAESARMLGPAQSRGALSMEWLSAALALAEQATRLDADNEQAWWTLAMIRLEREELEAATVAGLRALRANPWLKTALVRGLYPGANSYLERLLSVATFEELWVSLPTAR